MVFGNRKKSNRYIGVDIGASSIKFVELDLDAGEKPVLKSFGIAPLKSDVYSSNSISKREQAADVISELLAEKGALGCQAICAMPGASAFIKRMKTAKVPLRQLDDSIRMEASNLIPQNLDAIKLDYHIAGIDGRGQLDCILVAIKDDVLESFAETFDKAGVTLAVVDVEYFGLQNAFELAYPELVAKTCAVIDVGHRYCAVNICRNGDSLFTGDIPSGGRTILDSISNTLGVDAAVAREILFGAGDIRSKHPGSEELIVEATKQLALEFNRQLTFFWNASGADDGIDKILLAGGASRLPGFIDELKSATGLEVLELDPAKGIELDSQIDKEEFEAASPALTLAIGLAIRRPGDRELPELNDD